MILRFSKTVSLFFICNWPFLAPCLITDWNCQDFQNQLNLIYLGCTPLHCQAAVFRPVRIVEFLDGETSHTWAVNQPLFRDRFITKILLPSCKNFWIFCLFICAEYFHSLASYKSTGTKIFKIFDSKSGQKGSPRISFVHMLYLIYVNICLFNLKILVTVDL